MRRPTRSPCPALLPLSLVLGFLTGCGARPPLPPRPLPEAERGSRPAARPTAPPLFRDIAAQAGIRFALGHGGRSPLDILETLGHGAALLDVDGDGRLDIVLVGPDRVALYRNAGDGRFVDQTAASGLRQKGYWMGCAAADYDNDGRTDLFVTGYRCCALYHNEGRSAASGDVGESGRLGQSGGLTPGYASGAPSGRSAPAGQRRLAGGETPGLRRIRFREVTDAAGVRETGWSTSAGFADVDGDGRLDLYVARYVRFDPRGVRFCDQAGVRTACGPTTYDPERGRLWHNEGGGPGAAPGPGPRRRPLRGRVPAHDADRSGGGRSGRRGPPAFRDVTQAAGLTDAHGNALGVAFGDYDGDGRVDLAVANDQLPGDLFHNLGGGRFENAGVTSGIAYNAAGQAYAGMGIDWGDVDGDGRPDLAVTTYQHQPRCLYRQDRPGLFTDVAAPAGIGRATVNFLAFGARFFDADNDGWLDLALANGHVVDNIQQAEANVTYRQASQLFHNRGAAGPGRFEEISERAGPDFTRPIVGRGLCVGDLDDDGRLDLLIVDAEGAPLLLRNEDPSGHHWLSLRLIGTRSNRDAIGARVTLTAGGQSQTRACFTDGSFMSASDPRVHFGLGTAARADTIVIRWPSGPVTTLHDVPADRTLTVREGSG